MATPSASSLPPLNPERRRVAVSQFEHANQSVATGNFDYGIRLLLSCCKLDPGNLIYRQTLRRTEKAKYKNNLRGAALAWLTTWPAKARVKTALKTKDYLGVLDFGERVLTRDPWDVGVQMDMAAAADGLGQLDLAIWLLEQARQKTQTSAPVNRALARLYEKRGNFTQAIALWNLVRKAKPADQEAGRKLKDLAVNETIARGNYDGAVADAAAMPRPNGKTDPPTDQVLSKSKEYRVGSAAAKTEGAARRRRRIVPAARRRRSVLSFRPTLPTPACTCSCRRSTAGTMISTRPAQCCKKG